MSIYCPSCWPPIGCPTWNHCFAFTRRVTYLGKISLSWEVIRHLIMKVRYLIQQMWDLYLHPFIRNKIISIKTCLAWSSRRMHETFLIRVWIIYQDTFWYGLVKIRAGLEDFRALGKSWKNERKSPQYLISFDLFYNFRLFILLKRHLNAMSCFV